MSDEGAGDFLARLTAKLTGAGVPHMVVGSFASSAEAYYADRDAAVDALPTRGQLNVIDMATAWKRTSSFARPVPSPWAKLGGGNELQLRDAVSRRCSALSKVSSLSTSSRGRAQRYPCCMGDTVSLADVARVAVDDFRRGREMVIDAVMAHELATAIELALLTAVRGERRACAAACTRRGELWERTGDRPGASEPIRHEAKHRANEARYLADLIATRS